MKKKLFGMVGVCVIAILFVPYSLCAFERGDLTVTGHFKNESYFHLNSGTDPYGNERDDLMSSRNELAIDVTYQFTNIPILKRGFVGLKPVYDAVFDWSNKGTGDGSDSLQDQFEHNFGEGDDWDPLLRELWLEFSAGKLEARVGRQLVSWGKSDGIYMLDVIHPFNYRNWCIFEEEDTKIPLWMLNLNYQVQPGNSLQFLYIPRYVGSHDGFGKHDWTPNVGRWLDEYYGAYDTIFASWGFGGYPVVAEEPGSSFEDSEFGVRWSGWWKGLSYTLNYFYTWDDYLNDYPAITGDWLTALSVDRHADRISIFGGSFDYCWDSFLGLKQLVTRGEVAYTKNDAWYDRDFYIAEKDVLGIMLGFDKYCFVDYWVSIQVQQSYILSPDQSKEAYYDIGAYAPSPIIDPDGFPGTFDEYVGAQLGSGMRDAIETNLTFYIMKDYLPGDTLHFEFFVLYDDDGAWWFRPKLKYDISDQLHITLGANFFSGNEDDPFVGESRDNDNIFTELSWGF